MLILGIFGASIIVVALTVAFDIVRDLWQHRERQSGKSFEFFYFALVGLISLYDWAKKNMKRKPKTHKSVGSHRRIRNTTEKIVGEF